MKFLPALCFLSYSKTSSDHQGDDFLDRCNVVAPPPVGQIPPTENPFCKPLKLHKVGTDGLDLSDTVTVVSESDADATKVDAQSQTEQATSSVVDGNVATPVDDDGGTVDNGVNAEAQVDAITPSHSVDTAEGGAIGGVVLADNADELLTLPPETESDAVDADSEHSSIALDACEENADATKADAQSSQAKLPASEEGEENADADESTTTADLVSVQADKDPAKSDKKRSKKPFSPWLPPMIYASLLARLTSEGKAETDASEDTLPDVMVVLLTLLVLMILLRVM